MVVSGSSNADVSGSCARRCSTSNADSCGKVVVVMLLLMVVA